MYALEVLAILIVGFAIGLLAGQVATEKKIQNKAELFNKGYAYRYPIDGKLYVVMEEHVYEKERSHVST